MRRIETWPRLSLSKYRTFTTRFRKVLGGGLREDKNWGALRSGRALPRYSLRCSRLMLDDWLDAT